MDPRTESTADAAWTVQRILQWTAGFLADRGVESARLESELLLAHARGCPRIRLYTDFEAVVPQDQRARMRELVQRRARREPLAYIIGEREFYGRPFFVGPGVLVPRPETELLIDLALESLPADAPLHIADVGAGSACIAVTMAVQRPSYRITATELSRQALDFAARNIARHEVGDRVQLLQGDLLLPIRETGERSLDAVLSNPPYIRDGDMDGLAPEVVEYEPCEALAGGPDGLDCIRRLVEQSAKVIRPGGFMALEIDPPQADSVSRLLEQSGFRGVLVKRDLNGDDRIVAALRSP